MDTNAKPEVDINELVAYAKDVFKGNKLVTVGVMPKEVNWLLHREKSPSFLYKHKLSIDPKDWVVSRIERCLNITPGKEYHIYIQKIEEAGNLRYIYISDILLEKLEPPKEKVKKEKKTKKVKSRCPYDYFFG